MAGFIFRGKALSPRKWGNIRCLQMFLEIFVKFAETVNFISNEEPELSRIWFF